MQRIISFFQGVGSEMRKVRWPQKNELVKYTVVVLVTVVLFGIFFTLVDLGISSLIELIP